MQTLAKAEAPCTVNVAELPPRGENFCTSSAVPLKRFLSESSGVSSHSLSLPLPFMSSLSDSSLKPIAVELCAGSAKLSFGLKKAGFSVVPVDHARNKHKQWLPTITIDLAEPLEAQIISDLCLSTQPLEVLWAGIPCGTCSRAREIPITIHGRPGPKPLRSADFPRGLPNLAPWDQLKVSKANHIYDFVSTLIHRLIHADKVIIIENPRGSWLWELPQFSALLNSGFVDVDFQHCKWCPSSVKCRAKWTRLRTNCHALQQLAGPCRQSHVHLPWGFRDNTFATAGEAEYHAEMVQAISDILCAEVSKRGYSFIADDPTSNISTSQPHKRRRAATNKQPRGKQLPAVISEFKEVVKIPTTNFNTSNKGFKFLRSETDGGEPAQEFVIAGVFRTPKEFLSEAKSTIHPADLPGSIPDELTLTIIGMLESSPKEYANKILTKIRELSKLVHDLRNEDKAFIDALDIDSQLIMKGKRIASLEALRKKIGWQDNDILDQVFRGVNITGLQAPVSGFNQELTLPSCSIPELRPNSVWNNKAMATRTRSYGCPETDRSFWDAQLAEVAKDWLLGPFDSVDEVAQVLVKHRMCTEGSR